MSFRICLLLTVIATASSAVADWRAFRGTDTASIADGETLPTDWESDDVVSWQVNLPGRGLSSPIVVADRVIVTASSGFRQDKLHVLCFAAVDGNLLWERQYWATGRTATHPKTCVAGPTPASDGERIFASFSSNDVVALDLDGNLLWYRGLSHDYPNAANSLGMSSSLVVVDETVIAMVENDVDSFATGLDAATGEPRWRIARPRRANWTSPAIWQDNRSGQAQVLIQSSAGVAAVNPATGETVWSYDDGASTIPSVVASGELAIVPSHGLTAIRPGLNTPEVAEIVWRAEDVAPGTASPVVFDGSVFVIKRPNILARVSAETGEEQSQVRLSGNFSSTPVVAGGHLYCFSEEGVGHVVDPAGRGTVVSTRDFGDVILATPAVANGALYIRSDEHLWRISAP